MTLKGWVLGKVNPTAKPGRHGGERVAPSVGAAVDEHDPREPGLRGPAAGGRGNDGHLGRYAPLVAAIREALEAFVANELRLHLAIAERDRYILTSIDVECSESEEHRELLQRFMREFKPEQVKQYLARDVIAGLRNASAIDLTQFGGLNASRVVEEEGDDDPYRELVAQLQSADESPVARPYEVTIVGRWAEERAPRPGAVRARAPEPAPPTALHTPLAARPLALEVQDAGGTRHVQLEGDAPLRRYVVGKGEAADVVVDGVYASRRHCELWYEGGAWWVQDLGSTNGIRVEARGAVRRAGGPRGAGGALPLELEAGALLVLSAHGEGAPADYPRLSSLPGEATQVVAEAGALATPIAPARRSRATFAIAAQTATGVQQTDVPDDALPFRIGRSRNLGLVIDWTHADVSGLHLEITAVDDAGAAVSVLGDNGVRVGERTLAAGTRFHWHPGEEIVLGADAAGPRCRLTLERRA